MNNKENLRDRFDGCLLGLIVGDALGAPVEHLARGTFAPVTGMGRQPAIEPGQWTDDTSMALCLATSLIECKGHDARDQMTRYQRWRKEGYLSCMSAGFGIGSGTRAALQKFVETGDPYSGGTEPNTAGNGGIMRLAPAAMFAMKRPLIEANQLCVDVTRTTHALTVCTEASVLLGSIIRRAILGVSQYETLFCTHRADFVEPQIKEIAYGNYTEKKEQDIQGTGFVVKSLEAALWCFFTTDTFEDAVLKAVNLGDDADTTAAICGQVAGAFYGRSAIPKHWISQLAMLDEIEVIIEQLAEVLLKEEA